MMGDFLQSTSGSHDLFDRARTKAQINLDGREAIYDKWCRLITVLSKGLGTGFKIRLIWLLQRILNWV
jgi:hypothetical protein